MNVHQGERPREAAEKEPAPRSRQSLGEASLGQESPGSDKGARGRRSGDHGEWSRLKRLDLKKSPDGSGASPPRAQCRSERGEVPGSRYLEEGPAGSSRIVWVAFPALLLITTEMEQHQCGKIGAMSTICSNSLGYRGNATLSCVGPWRENWSLA